jgi:hypothetical protein
MASTNYSISAYLSGAGWFVCCHAKMTDRPTSQTSESLGLSSIRIPPMSGDAREQVGNRQEKKISKIPLPGLVGEGAFQGLRISALLKDRCSVTENGLVRVQLELSEHPPLGWSYIFLSVWQSMDYPMKSRVGVEEDTLWVEGEASEFKNRDFPEIQKAIDETNTRYRTVLQEQILAEQKREQLDRKTLETILGLDLGLNPRPIKKRPNRWLRAYLGPLAWSAFSAAWIVAGLLIWMKIPASEWSFIREPLLILIWSWILYAAAGRALSQFRQRYRIRKFVLRKRVATLWPDQYVDRRGRG